MTITKQQIEDTLKEIRDDLNGYYGGFGKTQNGRLSAFRNWLTDLNKAVEEDSAGYRGLKELVDGRIEELNVRIEKDNLIRGWDKDPRDEVVRLTITNKKATTPEPIETEPKEIEEIGIKSVKNIIRYLRTNRLLDYKDREAVGGGKGYDFQPLRDKLEEYNALAEVSRQDKETIRLNGDEIRRLKITNDQTLRNANEKDQIITGLREELRQEGINKTKFVDEMRELKKTNETLTNLSERWNDEKATLLTTNIETAEGWDRTKKELQDSLAREEVLKGKSSNAEIATKIKDLETERATLTDKVKTYEDWYEKTFGRLTEYNLAHTKKFHEDLTNAGQRLSFLTPDQKGVKPENIDILVNLGVKWNGALNLFYEILGIPKNENLPNNTYDQIKAKVKNASGSSDINNRSRSDLNNIIAGNERSLNDLQVKLNEAESKINTADGRANLHDLHQAKFQVEKAIKAKTKELSQNKQILKDVNEMPLEIARLALAENEFETWGEIIARNNKHEEARKKSAAQLRELNEIKDELAKVLGLSRSSDNIVLPAEWYNQISKKEVDEKMLALAKLVGIGNKTAPRLPDLIGSITDKVKELKAELKGDEGDEKTDTPPTGLGGSERITALEKEINELKTDNEKKFQTIMGLNESYDKLDVRTKAEITDLKSRASKTPEGIEEVDFDTLRREKATLEMENVDLTNRLQNKTQEVGNKERTIDTLKKEKSASEIALNKKLQEERLMSKGNIERINLLTKQIAELGKGGSSTSGGEEVPSDNEDDLINLNAIPNSTLQLEALKVIAGGLGIWDQDNKKVNEVRVAELSGAEEDLAEALANRKTIDDWFIANFGEGAELEKTTQDIKTNAENSTKLHEAQETIRQLGGIKEELLKQLHELTIKSGDEVSKARVAQLEVEVAKLEKETEAQALTLGAMLKLHNQVKGLLGIDDLSKLEERLDGSNLITLKEDQAILEQLLESGIQEDVFTYNEDTGAVEGIDQAGIDQLLADLERLEKLEEQFNKIKTGLPNLIKEEDETVNEDIMTNFREGSSQDETLVERVGELENDIVELNTTIANAENSLGVEDLNDLPELPTEGKLTDWTFWYNEVDKVLNSRLDITYEDDSRGVLTIDEEKIKTIEDKLERLEEAEAKLSEDETLEDAVHWNKQLESLFDELDIWNYDDIETKTINYDNPINQDKVIALRGNFAKVHAINNLLEILNDDGTLNVTKVRGYKDGSRVDTETLTALEAQVEYWKGAGDEIEKQAQEQVGKLDQIIKDTSAKLGIDIATNFADLENKLTNRIYTKTSPDGTRTEVVETIKLSETTQNLWYLETWYNSLRDILTATEILKVGEGGKIDKGTATGVTAAKKQARELREKQIEFEKIKNANIKLNDADGDHTKDRKLIEDNNKVSETILNLLDNALNNIADTGTASKEAELEKTINDARDYLEITGKLTKANLREFKEAVSEAQKLRNEIRVAMEYGGGDDIPDNWHTRAKNKMAGIKTKIANLLGADESIMPDNWETATWQNDLTKKSTLTERERQIRNALNIDNRIALDGAITDGKSWDQYFRGVNDALKTLLKMNPVAVNEGFGTNWANNLIHKRDLGLAPAEFGNVNTILGGKTLQQLRTDSDNLTTINTALTGTGKTLNQLIADSTAHAGCGGGGVPCGLVHCPDQTHHTEYTRIHTKLGGRISEVELQALLDAIPTCPHTDYDDLKTERDTLKTENEELKGHECDCDTKVIAKEKEVVSKIITDLSLSTPKEQANALDAIITEIKNKITPPAFTKDTIKTELDKLSDSERLQVIGETKPSVELVQKVSELTNELGATVDMSKLEECKTYEELVQAQNQMVKNKLNSVEGEKKTAVRMNYGLGVLSVGALVALAYLIVKTIKGKAEKSLEVKK